MAYSSKITKTHLKICECSTVTVLIRKTDFFPPRYSYDFLLKDVYFICHWNAKKKC